MRRILREISLNWKSGLTVALVSVPLSISLAIASNATPIMGIITAIWAGLVAAAIGGSQFNVVGPAGALSGILASFAITNGMQMLPVLAVLSGILIFFFYLLQWDKYLVFIPSSVMHGFTLGVGLTIGLGQVNAAFGLKDLPLHESPIMNLVESFGHMGQMDIYSCALFIATLSMLFGLARLWPRIPGAVIAAFLGIIVGWLSETHVLSFAIPTLFSKYGTLHATLIQPPTFAMPVLNATLAKAVFTVSIVAVLETLLSAKIVDGMTNTRFNQKKEMLGLALANIASGLAGGLPSTGVLARTALNAKSGATSRYSSGLNALFVMLIALVLFRGFQYLPLSVVAGILVFAAVRMVESEHFVKIFRFDPISFWLSMVVAALTFGVDPMIGILIGATVALLLFVQHLSKGRSEVTLHKNKQLLARIPRDRIKEFDDAIDVIVYRFAGELTYFNGKSHEDALKKIAADTLILSMRNLFYIDLDGLETLLEIIKDQKKAKRRVLITGVNEFIRPLLQKVSWFTEKEKAGNVFESTTDALRSLGFPLGT